MLTHRDILRRFVQRSGIYTGSAVSRGLVNGSFHGVSVLTKCQQLLTANGGASTIRSLTRGCKSGNLDVTLTDCAKLVKQGATTSQPNGQVQSR